MPTKIKLVEEEESKTTLMRVAGEMFADDAEFVKKLAIEKHEESAHKIIIDLGDLTYLDSDAASILRRLTRDPNYTLEGLDIFLQTAVDQAEGRA